MFRFFPHHWRILGIVSIAMFLLPSMAQATGASQLFFRPHCEKQTQEECDGFLVKDPLSYVTSITKPGDTIDLDLVLKNEGNAGIQRVRAWISYDPDVLEGQTVTVSSAFPVPTPGENAFSASDGFVKIQATTKNGKASGAQISIAHIIFKIKKVPAAYATVLSFYEVKPNADGHTLAAISKDDSAANLLMLTQAALFIPIQDGAQNGSSSSSATGGTSSFPTLNTPPSSVAGGTSTAFSLLQVQNLGLTTEGNTLYIGWEALRSSELAGYNVYYGTRSGQYMLRKSLTADSTSAVIRNLPVDTTYYVAIRAVNRTNEESAFSQEQAVKIGSPATSTSPLIGKGVSTTGGKNPVKGTTTVPGAAGLPPAGILLLLVCAVAGTFFALRRQFAASTHHS